MVTGVREFVTTAESTGSGTQAVARIVFGCFSAEPEKVAGALLLSRALEIMGLEPF